MSSLSHALAKMNHFVFLAYPVAGHLRPMTSTILNLLSLHPQLHITLLLHSSGRSSFDELVRLAAVGDAVEARLKVITALRQARGFGRECWVQMGEDGSEERDGLKGTVVQVLVDLIKGKTTAWDHGKGESVDGLCGVVPALVITDSFIPHAWQYVDKACALANHNRASLPLHVFGSPPLSNWIHWKKTLFPRRLALIAEIMAAHRAAGLVEPDATDEEIQAADEFGAALEKRLKEVPEGVLDVVGVPKMFMYEPSGQRDVLPSPPPTKVSDSNEHFFTHFYDQLLFRHDGLVSTWSSAILEPGALVAAREVAGKDKKIVSLGAQVPRSSWDKRVREIGGGGGMSEGDKEVLRWLDQAETWLGEKKVLFIAFGSFFFPARRPDLITHLIETLLSLPTPRPFLLALGSPISSLSDDLRTRVAASGRGLICGFAPQHDVLAHPATGWFLSHGGSNSALEALVCGVPMIFWPFVADQPLIAAQLTQELDVAFELLQVRVSANTLGKPTFRGPVVEGTAEAIGKEMREVLDALDEEEGQRKRANIERISQEMRIEWEARAEGGLGEYGRRGL